ncbi:MMPL family transporter [Haloarchaeobius iranensis]|uniref:Predicted exporter protein, RND superfamily n=1 Tax=Haloarchaeobius iranensis TaxID=996166 RepID=A0A1G9Z7C5_9EURY|nr:MMPL family transporter [Haloarchaeobius iranensis]SDN16985.1 Predicted exporter protein, RND superfamily [Haloarchaeobius iranensis]
MKALRRLTDGITSYSKLIIAVMLVMTVVLGAGAGSVSSESGLSQFESDTPEAAAQTYISENLTSGDQETQTTQVIVRSENGNVLSQESLLRSLEFQQTLRNDADINATLIDERPIVGVSNIVAIASIQGERIAELEAQGAQLQARQQQLEADQAALEDAFEQLQADRAALQQRTDTLNATADQLQAALTEVRENPNASIRTQFEGVRANSSVTLNESHYAVFEQAGQDIRNATNQSQVERAYQLGTVGVLQDEYAAVEQRGAALQQRAAELQEQRDSLEERGAELEADFAAFQEQQAALQSASTPTLAEQREQLESMNESELDSVLETVLGNSGGEGGNSPFAGQAIRLMEQEYSPGSTEANARTMVIQQAAQSSSDVGGGASVSDVTIDAQLVMQEYAQNVDSGEDYLVFGFGIISNEIDQSMEDSLAIVGPLAILFVLITLTVAYRDALDIVLGLFGIGVVLTWTFGYMGYAGISFNQIMIAVPVLLIGLSIDYAIHIFMRQREERLDDNTPSDVRGSMSYALAGVGVALIWVTATTVIGFLSNLTSPLAPIQEFGVVSSVGIVAALVVFGAFIPALKVEFDGFLEERLGWDRKKRAFGTGGGRFSQVLSVGSTLAKKAPVAVILVALLLSVGGAAGATQVDTSFQNEDFIADEPPNWMYDLPEPLAPGEYSAKSNLDYVNDNFQREDSQAQVLIKAGGDGTGIDDPATLQALHEQQELLGDNATYQTPFVGATDEVAYRSPLTVMETVAAQNASFNESYRASLGPNGVPEENVTALYDQLFEVAPQQAGDVIYRTEGGDYAAMRLVVPTDASTTTTEQTEEMRAIATAIEDGGNSVTVIATGSPVVNEVVQNQLLDTVIQSLVITLVAVFAFLMIAYRITEGSATLGIVTLLPVALSVTWILGTMYLIGMPFNVLTGMITSLTVGLGVAYSIHVSERFNLELGRRDTKWDAMDKTITGTGGALLGSAATTVGGFGVLSFAIFPALQQFGVITALTIIYAFLASVLVLPSLLVVWQRYLGPEETESMFDDDTDAGDAVATANGGTDEQTTAESGTSDPTPTPGETTEADTTAATGPATAESDTTSGTSNDAAESASGEAVPSNDLDLGGDGTELADVTEAEATADTGETTSDGESAVMDPEATDDAPDATAVGSAAAAGVAADDDNPTATRTVSDERPEPGTDFQVTLSVEDVQGRVVLSETVPGSGGRVTTLSPNPTSHSMVGRRLYVAWEFDEPTELTLTYEATVPAGATAGEELSFDATLSSASGEATFDGPAALTVTTPFLREALDGPVTRETLDRASDLASDGDLTRDELESLYDRWLDGDE